METPTPRNQPLFDHMAQEHGLALTVSECDDIEHTVARMMADDRRRETEHSASLDVRSSDGVALLAGVKDALETAIFMLEPPVHSKEAFEQWAMFNKNAGMQKLYEAIASVKAASSATGSATGAHELLRRDEKL